MHSDDKHKNINESNYKFFLLQPGLRNVWPSCHGDGVDGCTVVLGHVHLREHSDVVVLERRHDEGLVPKLLAHHLHNPVRSRVSQAGESQHVGNAPCVGRLVDLLPERWHSVEWVSLITL